MITSSTENVPNDTPENVSNPAGPVRVGKLHYGMIQCRIHKIDVVIGSNGLMFCPLVECPNSEANY